MTATIVIAPFHRWVSAERRRPQAVPSLTCVLFTGSHDAVDPRPYVVGGWGAQRVVTACRGCHEVMASLTTAIPERRA